MNLNDKHLAFKWKDLPFEEMIPLYKSSFSQYFIHFIQLPSHTEIFSLIIKFFSILNSGNSLRYLISDASTKITVFLAAVVIVLLN